MNMDSTLLTDSHWALIGALLPDRVGRGGAGWWPEIIGVLSKPCAGWGARACPVETRPRTWEGHRVFVRFSRWRTRGVWAQVLATLEAVGQTVPNPRQRQAQLDSASMRAHQHAAGAREKGPQALGRSRGGFFSKLHGAGVGGLLAFVLTSGQAVDAPQAADLLSPLLTPARQVLADTAYDSNAIRTHIAETGAVAVIPPRPNRLVPPHLDPLTYRDRNQVERLINRLKPFRRLAMRYDKLADSHAAFVQLRPITCWLN